jgi:hypothetical protein
MWSIVKPELIEKEVMLVIQDCLCLLYTCICVYVQGRDIQGLYESKCVGMTISIRPLNIPQVWERGVKVTRRRVEVQGVQFVLFLGSCSVR